MYRLNTKIADQKWEFDEICRLNHQTFTGEIQQHDKTSTGLLVDKFHSENQYIICLNESEIVGMVALRDQRPFSLDFKLEKTDDYLPPHKLSCEIRLLIVKPAFRNSRVILFLFREIFYQSVRKQYDLALISGILSQQRLYRSLGFVPFGPVVGETVKFQPMYLTSEFFFHSRHYSRTLTDQNKIINALPGPVTVKNIVSEEYKKLPESHRSESFHQNYKNICTTLSRFVNAENVQIFTGSATLANEVILSHLLALSKKGLIVSNGEFGSRIIHEAKCQKICFDEYSAKFGEGLDVNFIEQLFDKDADIKWLFVVHCETSTGVINDIPKLINICNQRNILIALDCISSFGIIPLDLSKAYMASASSGKAIGSFAGLSMVFFNELLQIPDNSIPLYLDIWYYIKKKGIPFTLNSNALNALGAAVKTIDLDKRYHNISEKSSWLRHQITRINPNLLCYDSNELHPAIITLRLPETMNSSSFGELLENQNILVNYNSEYLQGHNLIQICLFSDISEEDLQHLVSVLKPLLVPSGAILTGK
jgi:aspartate aminotransferase-like enzyme